METEPGSGFVLATQIAGVAEYGLNLQITQPELLIMFVYLLITELSHFRVKRNIKLNVTQER